MKEDWKECKLGDVCYFAKDKVSVSELNNDIYISTENMIPNRGGITKATNLPTGEQTPSFESGDILVSNIRPYFKKIWKASFSGGCSADVLNFKSRNNISNDFLYYILSDDEFFKYCMTTSKGTKMPRGDKVAIMQYPINLPPLATQQKIATILSSLDDKIELNNKINDNLEQQAQAIFKSWFVDFEPFGGVMPEGWRMGKLGEFVEIKRGGSPRPIQNYLSNSGFRWLKISDVTSFSAPFVLNIAEHIKEDGLSKTVFLKSGALVLSNSATPGIPKILDLDTCIHDGWLYFPSSQFSNEYLYLLFKEIRPQLVNLGNGSIFTNLKTDILKNFDVVLPNQDFLENFQNIIKPIFEKILNTQREIKQLEILRDSLLPKLMNGEIEVGRESKLFN